MTIPPPVPVATPIPVLRIALRAVGQGIITMILVPFLAAMAALALGHLAGACGPGSSGGCEMGAAGLAFYAVVPGFLIGAIWSVFRDLRSLRTALSAPPPPEEDQSEAQKEGQRQK